MPLFAQVALDTPVDQLFDYGLPENLQNIRPGSLVEVPFGRTRQVGVVLHIANSTPIAPDKLRHVLRHLDDRPTLAPHLIHFAQFCADYYHYPLGPILLSILPPRLRDTAPFSAAAPWLCLTDTGATAEPPLQAHAQRKLLAAMRAARCQHRDVIRQHGQTRHAATLVEAGWAQWQSTGDHNEPTASPSVLPDATSEQQHVLDAVLPTLDHFHVHLLHGATGSGKTEVYLRLIAATHARSRQSMVLIPEIALTPQIENLFRARFTDYRIALLHSGLNHNARAENWLAAAECDLLLGTRLSVFAPMPRLGLIVVDEEHDTSFKQQEGLRYSARDMAIARAKMLDIPIVLGSATPSLDSYAQAIQGRYQLLEMRARAFVGATLPEITLVDLRHVPVENGLTRPVLQALTDNHERGEQSLVFLNRRGYAPTLYCAGCGWVSPCPRCSARLVLHRSGQRLKCHHCGHEARIPTACPSCESPDLKALGQGTQRLEETLTAALPNARIRRIDRDTMRPRAWAELGDDLRSGQVDILVGTQMLAKGHDFPNMTLAVILDTDGALYSPDFRATERLFAQLMQVSGRAGRADKPGRVLVQTAFPEHPLFLHLLRHDYAAFAMELLAERRKLDLPPYTRQALLRAEAPQMSAAMTYLRSAVQAAPDIPQVSVFDPTPAPMARVAGLERAQLLIQSASRPALQQFLADWRPQLAAIKPQVARWSLDVDPLEF
ncbi:MAG: primosomal protein N' [Thiobacillus sp.]